MEKDYEDQLEEILARVNEVSGIVYSLAQSVEWLSSRVLEEKSLNAKRDKIKRFRDDLREAIDEICDSME